MLTLWLPWIITQLSPNLQKRSQRAVCRVPITISIFTLFQTRSLRKCIIFTLAQFEWATTPEILCSLPSPCTHCCVLAPSRCSTKTCQMKSSSLTPQRSTPWRSFSGETFCIPNCTICILYCHLRWTCLLILHFNKWDFSHNGIYEEIFISTIRRTDKTNILPHIQVKNRVAVQFCPVQCR